MAFCFGFEGCNLLWALPESNALESVIQNMHYIQLQTQARKWFNMHILVIAKNVKLPFLDIQNSRLLPKVCEGDSGRVNWGLPTVVLEV